MMHRWFRNPVVFILTPLVMALLFAVACGDGATSTPRPAAGTVVPTAMPGPAMLKAVAANPKRGGTLKWAGQADTQTFDLHQCNTGSCILTMGPLFDNLIRRSPLDGGVEIIPDLAHTWNVSADGLTYTFELREGVKFHDGAPLTAEDVKATFDRIIFPPEGMISHRKGVLDATQAVNVVDPLTVEFVLKQQSGFLIAGLANGWNVILRKKTLEDNNFDLKQVEPGPAYPGTGPFTFESFEGGAVFKVQKNPDYWNPELPYLDGIVLNHTGLGPPTAAALIAGEVDYVMQGGPPLLEEDPSNITAVVYGINSHLGVFINHTSDGLDKPKVRKAINLVLDRCVIVKNTEDLMAISHGLWVPASDAAFGKAYRDATLFKKPGYQCPTASEDIAAAKALLAEAGYPDGQGFPKIDLLVRNINFFNAWGPIVQGAMKQHLNIESEIRTAEKAVVVEAQNKGTADMFINGLSAPLDHPAVYLKEFYGTGAAGNWNFGSSNADLDAVLAKMAVEGDLQKTRDLFNQAIDILDEWVPMLSFGHAVIIDGYRTGLVKGREKRFTLWDDNRFDTVWLDQ